MEAPQAKVRFPTTRWTGVLNLISATDPGQRKAILSGLCAAYWYPLYAFARRSGRAPEDAEDLTQGFFGYAIEHEIFAAARRELGTLRTFLLRVFQRFMSDARDRDFALKRGGGREIIPLHIEHGEECYGRELVVSDSPERMYDRSWAYTVLRSAEARLACAEEEAGRGNLFAALRPFLSPDAPEDYERHSLCAEFGMSPEAIRQTVCRLRKKFRACLRETIALTLDHATDERVDEELRALQAALRPSA